MDRGLLLGNVPLSIANSLEDHLEYGQVLILTSVLITRNFLRCVHPMVRFYISIKSTASFAFLGIQRLHLKFY